MESKSIQPIELEFNDFTLTCPIEEGHRMVPVRTVCEIIDVDFKRQDSWLKQHPFFTQLYNPRTTVAADNKQRIMNCLSIFDIDGWLHSIGSKNRKPDSIEKQYAFLAWLREKKMELYKSIDLFMEENKYELELIELKESALNELEEAQGEVKKIKDQLKKINKSIDDVREKRFTGQTALKLE